MVVELNEINQAVQDEIYVYGLTVTLYILENHALNSNITKIFNCEENKQIFDIEYNQRSHKIAMQFGK